MYTQSIKRKERKNRKEKKRKKEKFVRFEASKQLVVIHCKNHSVFLRCGGVAWSISRSVQWQTFR